MMMKKERNLIDLPSSEQFTSQSEENLNFTFITSHGRMEGKKMFLTRAEINLD